nr:polymeric immunoglobulin receptor-like protein [Paralichthys olivaceus]
MNNMKSLALILLSLITGCEAESVVRGCAGGWFELTCNHSGDLTLFKLNTRNDKWERFGRFYPYQNQNTKRVRFWGNPLKEGDAGIYTCQNNTAPVQLKLIVSAEDHVCKKPLHQTTYTGAETTFTCEYPGISESNVKFFCKNNSDTCEEILSTQSSQRSNGTFSLTITTSGFNVSIKDVSSQDAGVYWCGLKIQDDNKTSVGLRKIHLNVTIQPSAPTPASAENQGRFKVLVTVIISVIVFSVILLLILIPVTKRIRLSRSDSRRNEAAAQQDRELLLLRILYSEWPPKSNRLYCDSTAQSCRGSSVLDSLQASSQETSALRRKYEIYNICSPNVRTLVFMCLCHLLHPF